MATIPQDKTPPPAFEWANIFLFALLILFTGIALFNAGAGALFQFPRSFNEGWNAYFAVAAFEGPLYFPPDAPVVNNYPPVSFYLIGGLAQLGGDIIFIGRAVSAIALIVLVITIYAILQLLAVDRMMAAATAIAFLGFIAIGFPDGFAINEPQWLAHAIMFVGLMVFISGYPRRTAIAASAILMLLGGLAKHNLLPLPLAVTIWLLVYERRGFWIWCAVCLAGAVLAFGALVALHGMVGLEAILLLKREYVLLKAVNALYQYIAPSVPLVILFFISGTFADRRVKLVVLYTIIGLIWGLYTLTAVGVEYNGMFDYYIAVALLTGLALGRLQRAARPAALTMLALPIIAVVAMAPKPHRVWQDQKRQEAQFREDIALIRGADGPAMCTTSSLCFWAGKHFDYDPFNAVRKMRVFPAYRQRMVGQMNSRYFAIIQVYSFSKEFPPEFVAALKENYVQFHTSETGRSFFRRR